MDTEKAYRDIGQAVVTAFLSWECFPPLADVTVHARRLGEFEVSFFVDGNQIHVAQWPLKNLETIATINRYKKAEEER